MARKKVLQYVNYYFARLQARFHLFLPRAPFHIEGNTLCTRAQRKDEIVPGSPYSLAKLQVWICIVVDRHGSQPTTEYSAETPHYRHRHRNRRLCRLIIISRAPPPLNFYLPSQTRNIYISGLFVHT